MVQSKTCICVPALRLEQKENELYTFQPTAPAPITLVGSLRRASPTGQFLGQELIWGLAPCIPLPYRLS